MPNLTLSVDEDLIKRARVRAIQQGTSLSAKVREFLQRYADESDDLLSRQRQASTQKLLDTMAVAADQARPAAADASPQRAKLRDDLYPDDYCRQDRAAPQPAGK